tara:strand:- start:608 stop:928 length:321 start_codon:yes stop_codon:yes gene_type:complete
MTAYQESLRLFRKIAPFFRYFLLFYVILAMLPIHRITGSNIQSIIADGLMGHYNTLALDIRRILWAILYIFAFLTNDTMLIAGLIFFTFWNSDNNKDNKDKGHRYI